MFIITHATLPVLLANGRELWLERKGREKKLTRKTLLLIALAGALADLLNPHITLKARLDSWSHSLLALVVFGLLLLLGISFKAGKAKYLFTWFFIAYALHLFCDALAGGICLMYPSRELYGAPYLVGGALWVAFDIACLLMLYAQSWYRRFRLIRDSGRPF